jgi:hypothetical protein
MMNPWVWKLENKLKKNQWMKPRQDWCRLKKTRWTNCLCKPKLYSQDWQKSRQSLWAWSLWMKRGKDSCRLKKMRWTNCSCKPNQHSQKSSPWMKSRNPLWQDRSRKQKTAWKDCPCKKSKQNWLWRSRKKVAKKRNPRMMLKTNSCRLSKKKPKTLEI